MSPSDYSEKILLIIQKDNPKTVLEVIDKAETEYNIPRNKTFDIIEILKEEGEINVLNTIESIPKKLFQYLTSIYSLWYWVTITLSVLLPISELINLDSTYPYLFIRQISNTIFLLFIPGHSLTKILFTEKEIDDIEKLTYSLGISIVLIPMVGFLLNYSHWDISFYPLTLSLSIITIIASTIGIIIEYRHRLSLSLYQSVNN